MGSTLSIPTDLLLGCLLSNLKLLQLTPDLKPPKLIHFKTQAWPQYLLDNQRKWPPNGSLDPNIIPDIYNFCVGKGNGKRALMSLPSLLFAPSLFMCLFTRPLKPSILTS